MGDDSQHHRIRQRDLPFHSKMLENIFGEKGAFQELFGNQRKGWFPDKGSGGGNGKPVVGIVPYGNGEFDGQGSGHDFYGTLYTADWLEEQYRRWPVCPLP